MSISNTTTTTTTVQGSMDIVQTIDPLLKYSWFPNSQNYYFLHLHEIVYSFIFYHTIFTYIAPLINKIIFNGRYNKINNKKLKMDFDVHIVSMVQSFVSLYIIWPVLTLPMTSYNIATYQNDYCSMITSLSAGYFIWDLIVCLKYFSVYGFQYLIHAIFALATSLIPLLPVCQVWIPKFLLYEASTPFVNINWFIMQLISPSQKTGLRPVKIPNWLNLINGVLLMTIFFFVRILWGNLAQFVCSYQLYKYRSHMNLWKTRLSMVLAFVTFVLNILNVFWFSKMVKIAKKLSNSSNDNDKKRM